MSETVTSAWLVWSALDTACTASNGYLQFQDFQAWVSGLDVAAGQPAVLNNVMAGGSGINYQALAGVDGDNSSIVYCGIRASEALAAARLL